MRPFASSRPSSVAEAVLTVDVLAADPRSSAAFLAGGTTLIDLMKLDVVRPSGSSTSHSLGRTDGDHPAGRIGAPPRRVRQDGGRRGPCDRRRRLSRDRPEPVARGQRAAAQHGEPRRQRAAADPLQLLPRSVLERLQQARPGQRVRRARRAQSLPCGARDQPALHRDVSRRLRAGLRRAGGVRRGHRRARTPNNSVRVAASPARCGAASGRRACSRAS